MGLFNDNIFEWLIDEEKIEFNILSNNDSNHPMPIFQASYDREGRDNFTNSRIYTSLYVEAGRSPSQAFLQVNADNQGVVDAGKTLSFSVKSTEPMMASLTYQVPKIMIK